MPDGGESMLGDIELGADGTCLRSRQFAHEVYDSHRAFAA
jgi:hypothetical protein